jgi:hypothetical protein
MHKREVVVGSKVFNLGLKEFEESVANKKHEWPTIELDVDHMVFQVEYIAEEKAVTLNWWGLTRFKNIVWTRFVFLRLGWPPVKRISAFTYATEEV